MEHINTSDLSGEEQYEAEAAFGEDADLVRLGEDDLEPVESTEYVLPSVLEEGDWITVQHGARNVTTGPVKSVDDISVTIDPQNRTASGYFGLSTLGVEDLEVPLDTPGDEPRSNVIDINGEPAARVVQSRQEDN